MKLFFQPAKHACVSLSGGPLPADAIVLPRCLFEGDEDAAVAELGRSCDRIIEAVRKVNPDSPLRISEVDRYTRLLIRDGESLGMLYIEVLEPTEETVK